MAGKVRKLRAAGRRQRQVERASAKALRVATKMLAPNEQPFPSRWPDAPELLDGVARTLGRGLP